MMPTHERLFDDLDADLAESNRAYETRLLGDRLTAEMRAPLTNATRRKKLRAQSAPAALWQEPEQVDLFGGNA